MGLGDVSVKVVSVKVLKGDGVEKIMDERNGGLAVFEGG